MITFNALASLLQQDPPLENSDLWHECKAPLIPRRTVTGRWTIGKEKLWRRKTETGWEYLQEPQWHNR